MKRTLLALCCLLFAATTVTGQSTEAIQSPGLDVVGFGYDVFGRYADMSSKKPIRLFELQRTRVEPIGTASYLVPEGIYLEPVIDHRVSTVEGSSVRQYSKSLAANAGLSMNGLFFKGSIETNIQSSESGSSSRYFFTYMDANNMWRISMDTVDVNRLRSILVPRVRDDINNLPPDRLFAAYGTHYIASAYLGGRADYTAVATTSNTVSAGSIKVAVEAQYKLISGSADLSTEHEATLTASNTQTTLRVVGGNAQFVNNIREYSQYTRWAEGIASRPVLCDFDQSSLRPIWELAATPGRREELERAFQTLLTKYPLPPELVNLGALSSQLYMVENKATGTFWDLPGYHSAAKTKGELLALYQRDRVSNDFEGADRFIKVIPNTVEEGWVFLQPQHSVFVLDALPESSTKGASRGVQLWDMSNARQSAQFKMESVPDETDSYFIVSRASGLYLAASADGQSIEQQSFSGDENQKWIFRTTDPKQFMAPPARGYYALQAVSGSKFWDFSGTYPAISSAKLQVWSGMPNERAADRHYEIITTDQSWQLIRPRHLPSHVLTAAAGQQLTVAATRRSNDQLWQFEYAGSPNTYIIRNRASSEVVQVDPANANANGAVVQSAAANNSDQQRWVLIPIANPAPTLHEGVFNIRLKGTTKFLDLPGNDRDSNENGKNVQVWDMDGGTDRRFKFVPASNGSGSFWIEIQNGGRMLDVQGGDERGANVQIWAKHNEPDQQWKVIGQSAAGSFNIQSLFGSKRMLDVSSSQLREKGNGANVQVWDSTGGASQLFEFVYVDGPNKGNLFQGE